MAALTSGSWTIAYLPPDRRMATAMTDRLKYVGLKLTLASGNPPTALKLPSYQSVGLVARLDKYIFDQPIYVASGQAGATVSGALLVDYTATGNSLSFKRVNKPLLVSGTGTAGVTPLVTTAVIASQIIYTTAVGW